MAIEEINFDYADESTTCKGVLFLPESSSSCPAVLVAHTWKGISDFEINKAKELEEKMRLKRERRLGMPRRMLDVCR